MIFKYSKEAKYNLDIYVDSIFIFQMTFYKVRSVTVVTSILLENTNFLRLQKLSVLQTWNALVLLMRVVTMLDLIVFAKRGL